MSARAQELLERMTRRDARHPLTCGCEACIEKSRRLMESTLSPARRRRDALVFRQAIYAGAARIAVHVEERRTPVEVGHAEVAREGAARPGGDAAPIRWRDGMTISDSQGQSYVMSNVTSHSCTFRHAWPRKWHGKKGRKAMKRARAAMRREAARPQKVEASA